MPVIRPYREKDWADVRYICLNSEGPCTMPEAGVNWILSTYCDYFIEQEGCNCFVAADENDRAVGYIFCAENYDKFLPVFEEKYLVRIPDDGTWYYPSAKDSTFLQKKYKDEYPAHMHIDVLPEYQRCGLGSKLVDALAGHLRSKGIKGVMLTVGADNMVGQNFYRKYGFSHIETHDGDMAFGLKL